MQSRFTDKAREALKYAQDTAQMLEHGYIGSDLLIGLIRAEGGLA